MPQGLGLGLEGAGGAVGGYDSLAALIARRQREQLLAQQEAERLRRYDLDLTEQGERRRQFDVEQARLMEQTAALNQYREDQAAHYQRMDDQAAAEEAEKARRMQEGITLIRNSQLPDNMKLIAEAGFLAGKFDPSDLLNPKETPEQAEARENRLIWERAKANAAYRKPDDPEGGGGYGIGVPWSNSPSGLGFLEMKGPNRGTIRPVTNADGTPAQGMGGSIGGAVMKKAAEFDQALGALNNLEMVGEKQGWRGAGPLSPVRGMLSQAGLMEDPEGDSLRAASAFVTALISHPLFGSALTATERALLNDFVASASTVGAVNKTKIAVTRATIEEVQRRVLQGPLAGNVPGAGVGVGGGVGTGVGGGVAAPGASRYQIQVKPPAPTPMAAPTSKYQIQTTTPTTTPPKSKYQITTK